MASQRSWNALWFGRQLFVQTDQEIFGIDLPEKDDPVSAVAAALSPEEGKPKTVRLIFQPLDITSEEVTLIPGGKGKNRETLGAKYSQLKNPNTAWSISRPQATLGGIGFQGLLFVDTLGLLPRLRAKLAQKGIALEGAWSPASVLETMDPTSSEGAAVMAIIMADGGAFVYAGLPSGQRRVGFVSGNGYRNMLGKIITDTVGLMAVKPATLLIENTAAPFDLSRTALENAPIARADIADLFAALRTLKVGSAGNFLTKQILVQARHVVHACAAAAFIATLGFGGAYLSDYKSLETNSGEQAKAIEATQAEITRLTANKAASERAEGFTKEMGLAGKGRMELLTRIVASRRPELTVRSLTFDDYEFVLKGTAHDGIGETASPFADFVAGLGWKEPPAGENAKKEQERVKWTFGAKGPPVLSSADFTVNGKWTSHP